MDGNYGHTMDVRLPVADTVIFLDFPRWVCLWQVLKRGVQYRGRTRPDIGAGCPEKVDAEFLYWVWSFPKRSRPYVPRRIAAYAQHARVIHLRSPREAERFLAEIEPASERA